MPPKKSAAPGAYMTIEEIQAEVDKKLGVGVLIRGSDALTTVPRLSSGILSLDLSLGGGWATNNWNELVGVESSGKTAVCYQTIAHNQKVDPDFVAMFVAAEEFVPSYAKSFGVDTDRMWIVETNDMETVFELVVKAVENRTVDMVVIDSLPALVTTAEADRNLSDGVLVSPGAKIISTFFKKMGKALRRSLTNPDDRPCTPIMINQWRDQIGVMFGDPRTTPGGKAKNYYFFVRLEVGRDEWIQEVKSDLTTRIGQTIAARTIKNKTYRPQQRSQFDFYFADGAGFKKGEFDTVKDLINVALSLDLFDPNTRYKWKGENVGGSKDALTERLRQDVGLRKEIWDEAHRRMFPHLYEEVTDVVEAGTVGEDASAEV